MYKLFIILTVYSFVQGAVIREGLTKTELKEIDKKTFDDCKKELNIKETLFLTNEGFTVAPPREVKCLMKCYIENLGILKNSKVDWETLTIMEKLYSETEEYKEKALKNVENCKNSVTEKADLCEYSFEVMECIANGPKKDAHGGSGQ